MLYSSSMFKKHRWTLSFENYNLENDYLRRLGELHVGEFRAAYALGFMLLVFKVALLGIAAATLAKSNGLEGSNNSNSNGNRDNRDVMEVLRLMQAGLGREDLMGELMTVLACCLALGAALGFSFVKTWFFQFHQYMNLLLFLVVGLVCITLPNVVDGSIKSFSVIAEVYILFFPFALLLRLPFARSVVGSWTIVVLFFVLRLVSKTASSTVDPLELATVGIYLVMGATALNLIAYSLDLSSRERFQFECQHSSEESPTSESVTITIPMASTERGLER